MSYIKNIFINIVINLYKYNYEKNNFSLFICIFVIFDHYIWTIMAIVNSSI